MRAAETAVFGAKRMGSGLNVEASKRRNVRKSVAGGKS